METRRNVSSEKVEAKQSLCMQLEQKQQKAQEKRDEVLTKVRSVAAAAAAPKGQVLNKDEWSIRTNSSDSNTNEDRGLKA